MSIHNADYMNVKRESERKQTTSRQPYFNSIVADIEYTVDILSNLKNIKKKF